MKEHERKGGPKPASEIQLRVLVPVVVTGSGAAIAGRAAVPHGAAAAGRRRTARLTGNRLRYAEVFLKFRRSLRGETLYVRVFPVVGFVLELIHVFGMVF